jgi:hypothetical protein
MWLSILIYFERSGCERLKKIIRAIAIGRRLRKPIKNQLGGQSPNALCQPNVTVRNRWKFRVWAERYTMEGATTGYASLHSINFSGYYRMD